MVIRRICRPLLPLVVAFGLSFGNLGGAALAASPPPLGVQDYEVPGVQVLLLSLKRTSDGYITAKWAYHNTTSSAKTIGSNTGVINGAWSTPFSLAWDAFISAGGQQYKVVPGGAGLLAGTHGGNKTLVLGPKMTYATWAKFKDPGKDVTKVSVSIQGAAPFDDAPIS
jgi:hypothetical protein